MILRSTARRLVLPVALGAAAMVTPADAHAQGQPQRLAAVGDDVVHLKDGGLLRGTLIEAIPGDHASLQLATGQIALIRWDAIVKIERGPAGVARAPGTAAQVPALPPAPAPQQVDPAAGAMVHVDTDRPARLERRTGRAWVFACQAPCDAPLDPDAEYRLAGDLRSSGAFRLQAPAGGRVNLQVNAASKGGFVGGIVLASVGLPVLLVGAVVTMVASAPYGGADAAKGTGLTLVGLGLGGMAVGTVLIVTNARSSVTQDPGTYRAARAPAWTEARLAPLPLPPAAPPTLTLFAGTF